MLQTWKEQVPQVTNRGMGVARTCCHTGVSAALCLPPVSYESSECPAALCPRCGEKATPQNKPTCEAGAGALPIVLKKFLHVLDARPAQNLEQDSTVMGPQCEGERGTGPSSQSGGVRDDAQPCQRQGGSVAVLG